MYTRILFISFLTAACLQTEAQTKLKVGNREYLVSQIENIEYKEIEMENTIIDALNEKAEYSIFTEALMKTGLCDSIEPFDPYKRVTTYHLDNPKDAYNNTLYYPKKNTKKYTVFIENNTTFAANGINSFDDLVAKCKEWYGNADEWYDYVKENGITVSTSNDYTNRFNVVNMFVAYHILKAGMPVDQIVYEKNNQMNWNYCFGYEPQAYFETMLPNSLVKAWETDPLKTKNLFLNRYRKNNTLTDQIATFGSDETHPIIYEGAKVSRTGSISSINGYAHSIDKPLIYDLNAKNALHERMRFNAAMLLPEIVNEGFRFASPNEIKLLNNGGEGSRVAMAPDFFENMKFYNETTDIRFCVNGAWRALESNQLQFYNDFDYAIKLPSVPTGTYELRMVFYPMYNGAISQLYIGESADMVFMEPLGIPFDATIDPTSEEGQSMTGFKSTAWWGDEDFADWDYGVKSDSIMRNNGYMRAPACFSRGSYNSITSKLEYDPSDIYSAARVMSSNLSNSCRTEEGYGTMTLRRIIGTKDLKQGKEYWLRMKKVSGATGAIGYFGFIELVPVDIVNNKDMHEDWY